MALFKKLFKKGDSDVAQVHKGFYELKVSSIEQITDEAVKVSFEIPDDLSEIFSFIPGQYINICVVHNGNEERRSYSICNAKDETLSIAIKSVTNGNISKWANRELKAGDKIQVSRPEGNFQLKDSEKTVVAIAAGSGITPILSIAKEIEKKQQKLTLFYGNKTEKSILFKNELNKLNQVKTTYFLSQEQKDGFQHGRITKDTLSGMIKQNLDLLKSDAFFICGPEDLIVGSSETLALFGVPKEKIHFELFTTPTKMTQNQKEIADFTGNSKVKVLLDDESIEFTLKSDGKSILDAVSSQGYDPPYSCRGGVCCTCKAKVLRGKASMTMNYSLTDQEVEEGYILTCQAHPASEELTVSYDA